MKAQLPTALCDYLKSGDQLQYDASQCEPGAVRLKTPGDIEIGNVWVGTDTKDDPNYGADGYYSIPAVSLLSGCEGYDPDFILLWLPNEQTFGSWDCDHWVLTVFPSASWQDIADDPAPYLNAQWDPGTTVGEKFTPWPRYEFRPGMP